MRTVIVVVNWRSAVLRLCVHSKHVGKGKVAGAIFFIGLWLIFCGFDYIQAIKAG